ncbi:MAG: hypothetical protein B6I24_02575 [Bacteroidetes bacterium 4572_128]|nr:MAG: hypothetical protein B6I24_02575 [Bacteroidetes bacterium 4572_128]
MKKIENFCCLILLIFIIFSCVSQNKTITKKEIPLFLDTLKGHFKSAKGSLKLISCYCYNGGYIMTKKKEKIPVCFKIKSKIENDKNVILIGYFDTKRIKSDIDNPCPEGELRFFKVVSYKYKL